MYNIIDIILYGRRKLKKKILKYISAPFVFSVIGCLLLLLVSFIPQSMVQKNASASAQQIAAHKSMIPRYINFWDWSYASDLHTDTLIVMGGYNLNNPSAVLLNPYRSIQQEGGDISQSFIELVDEGKPNDTDYVRYWQGFRVIIRPLLVLLPYFQIRQVGSWVFFVLLMITIAAIAQRKGMAAAVCFALAIVLVNPAIISHSLQYLPCFILAFLAILFLIYTENYSFDRVFVFSIFGMLTQFFDFYTAPIVVCGLPLLVWIMLDNENNHFLTILKSTLSWLYGYASIWLVKLLMVSVFTDVNGIADGLGAFFGRIGLKEVEVIKESYNFIDAFVAAWDMVTPGATGAIALAAVVLLVAVSAVIIWKTKGMNALISSCAYLAVAALPIIWFAAAAQPTVIHAYFQYRPLAVFFAGVFLFAAQALPFKEKRFFLFCSRY